jgi:ribosomal protein S12 methylthiotransferase accessory factor
MDMIVNLPGGLKVDSSYKGFTVKTDQPKAAGGDNSAPAPFDLFLHSIGTCAAFYVLSFCRERDIVTDDIRVVLNTERDSETWMVTKINIDIQLPADFPEKYIKAVKASADKCTVKKLILKAPAFNITASTNNRGKV